MKKPLIALAIFAGMLLLSVPLCGIGFNSRDSSSQAAFTVGLACSVLGVVGGFVSVIWLLVAAVLDRGAPPTSSGPLPGWQSPAEPPAPIYPPPPPQTPPPDDSRGPQ